MVTFSYDQLCLRPQHSFVNWRRGNRNSLNPWVAPTSSSRRVPGIHITSWPLVYGLAPFFCHSASYGVPALQLRQHWILFFFFHYSWFTVLCQFSTVQHSGPIAHVCILFLTSSSTMFHHERLDTFPCAVQQDLIAYLSKCNSLHLLTPDSQALPLPPPTSTGFFNPLCWLRIEPVSWSCRDSTDLIAPQQELLISHL